MPIEFRCTQCNRLLRTPDETAGKQAKCPECGAIVGIPAAGTSPEPTTPPPAASQPAGPVPPLPGAGPTGPFGPAGPPPAAPGSPFTPGAATARENPYASPADYTVGAPAAFAPPAGKVVPTRIEMGDVLGPTWEVFKQQWGMALALLLVAFLIDMGVSVVCNFIPLVGPIVSMVFSVWINIGVALGLLKLARGQKAEIGDMFTGGPYLVRILFASLLVGIIVLGIFGVLFGPSLAVVLLALEGAEDGVIAVTVISLILVCLIPVVIVSLMFSQFYYLILDQDVGILESLSLSRQVMVGNKLTVFLVNLVTGIIGLLLVILTCGLGLFAVGPYLALLRVVIYLAVTGQRTAQPTPAGQPVL